MSYPEHEKLAEVAYESQTIGQFLDWLQSEQGVVLAEYNPDFYNGHVPSPIHKSIQSWLAEYFDIDQDKIEAEKRAMIEEMRSL